MGQVTCERYVSLNLISTVISTLKGEIAHLRQECHNSEFGIFELLV